MTEPLPQFHEYEAARRLGRQLEAYVDAPSKQTENSEDEWDAAKLVASWLGAAVSRRLDREAAVTALLPLHEGDRAAADAALTALEKRYWVRFVLGRLEIPEAIRHASREPDAGLGDAYPALSTLYEARYGEAAHTLIARDRAESLRDQHAILNSDTPSFERICASGALAPIEAEERGSFLRLDVHGRDRALVGRNSWVRGAALFWESMCRSKEVTDDRDRLLRWLDVVGELVGILEVPTHLPAMARDRLLNSSLACLEGEGDLAGEADEPQRVRWEHEHALHPKYAFFYEAPRSEESVAGLYLRWKRIEDRFGWRGFHGNCRERVDLLTAMIVQADPSEGSYLLRFGRLLRLLQRSPESPYLALTVAASVRHSRPGAIPVLLLHPDTAALAHVLFEEATDSQSSFSFDGVRAASADEQRHALWSGSLELVSQTVSSRTDSKPTQLLSDLLVRSTATRLDVVRSPRPPDEATRRLRNQQSVELRRSLAMLRVNWTAHGAHGSGRPLILVARAAALHSWLVELSSVPAPGDSTALGVVGIDLQTWWLQFLTDTPQGEWNIGGSEAPDTVELAAAVVARYRSALELETRGTADPANESIISWVSEDRWAESLDWPLVATTMARAGRADELLDLEFTGYVRGLQSTAKRLADRDGVSPTQFEMTLESTWAHKIRLHLGVLLHIHRSWSTIAAQRPSDDLTHSWTADVERSIATLLRRHKKDAPAEGAIWIFDDLYEHPFWEVEQPSLLESTARAINRFDPNRRNDLLRAWIPEICDANALLVLARRLTPEYVPALVRSRLSAEVVQSQLDHPLRVDGYERAVENAVFSDDLSFAESLLDRGDNILKGHSLESQWSAFSFRMRLSLASRKGQHELISKLSLPPEIQKRPAGDLERTRLETSRSFYYALSFFSSDPARARDEFATLLARTPDSLAAAINYFAAGIQSARATQDPAIRRSMIESAIDAFAAFESQLKHVVSVESRDSIDYNKLLAWDLLDRHDLFDSKAAEIAAHARHRVEFASLLASNFQRRGLHDRATDLISSTLAFHRLPDGKLPPEVDKLQQAYAARAIRLSTAQVVPLPSADEQVRSFRLLHREILSMSSPRIALAFGQTGVECTCTMLLAEMHSTARELLIRDVHLRTLVEEDKLNDWYVSLLRMRLYRLGWQVADQSRGGASAAGGGGTGSGGVGERDWTFRDANGELAISEALRLSAVKKAEIGKHVGKLFKYDAVGAVCSFVVVYYEGANFGGFSKEYRRHIGSRSFNDWMCSGTHDVNADLAPYFNNLHTFASTFQHADGRSVRVYHLLLNVGRATSAPLGATPPKPRRRKRPAPASPTDAATHTSAKK